MCKEHAVIESLGCLERIVGFMRDQGVPEASIHKYIGKSIARIDAEFALGGPPG